MSERAQPEWVRSAREQAIALQRRRRAEGAPVRDHGVERRLWDDIATRLPEPEGGFERYREDWCLLPDGGVVFGGVLLLIGAVAAWGQLAAKPAATLDYLQGLWVSPHALWIDDRHVQGTLVPRSEIVRIHRKEEGGDLDQAGWFSPRPSGAATRRGSRWRRGSGRARRS